MWYFGDDLSEITEGLLEFHDKHGMSMDSEAFLNFMQIGEFADRLGHLNHMRHG